MSAEEIRRRHLANGQGSWEHFAYRDPHRHICNDTGWVVAEVFEQDETPLLSEAICQARADVLWLLEDNARLTRELDEARAIANQYTRKEGGS